MIILKSDAEIDRMRRAGRVAAQARAYVTGLVRPGVSTWELDQAAEQFLRQHDAIPSFKGLMGFPGSICTSVNDEVVHGIPNARKVLKEGDVISIDLGAQVDGYHGDLAFTVPVGRVPERVRNLLAATERALFAGIHMARPSGHVSDISHAIEQVIRPLGYGIVREYVGHGVGRTLHEDPQVPNYGPPGQGPTLKRGMVLAIEPMINEGKDAVKVQKDRWTVVTKDGKISAHFEHTVAVGDPPEILTRVEEPETS